MIWCTSRYLERSMLCCYLPTRIDQEVMYFRNKHPKPERRDGLKNMDLTVTNVGRGSHLKLRAFLKIFEPGEIKLSKERGTEKSAFPRHVNIVFEEDTT